MKTEELIERLSAFNEWRRGAETPQPSPKDIGEWIERACEILDEQARVLESLEAAIQSVTSLSKTLREERDEARADRDIARLSAQDSDRAHDRIVGELEKVYKERDDLREELCHLRACVFDALSALDAGAFVELKKAWEEGAK